MRKKFRTWRLAQMPKSIDTEDELAMARRYMTIFDHGCLRGIWHNRREISKGVWRSNYPSEQRLGELRREGIHHIITLRGQAQGPEWFLEQRACEHLGLSLYPCGFLASAPPDAAKIKEIIALLRNTPRPFLLHCKSGADRTSFAAALYVHVIEGAPVDVAMRQFSLRHIHLRTSKKGVLGYVFVDYMKWHRRMGGGFEEYLETAYDPVALSDSFYSSPFWRKLLWRWDDA